jgi:lipoprotein-anchoring transpeptidase ErfK/SrfK
VIWQTNTRGTRGARLRVTDRAIVLTRAAGTVWSSAQGNGCGRGRSAHEIIVRISQQRAWVCSRSQQQLVTPVTSGASALGDGTPTGTWHVYARVRDTTLYPAAGGAYHVNYWMPYDGAYGMHDSPWQTFPYGSTRYKTRGSHGCVHFPESAMRWLFGWAPTGTTVTIRR